MDFLKLCILIIVSASSFIRDVESQFTVYPNHYEIKITHQRCNGRFYGESVIELFVDTPIETMTLYYLSLDIDESETILISAHDNNVHYKPKHVFNVDTEQLTLEFDESIPVGYYSLYFEYYGQINESRLRTGYYEVQESTNEEREMIAGRFDFPCWIIEIWKATFSISVYHPSEFTALSTMPLEMSYYINYAFEKSTFQTTLPMSLFQVCYVLLKNSEFSSISDGKLTIWTRDKNMHSIKLAQKIAMDTLKIFEEYTSLEFPLPKLDFVICDFEMSFAAVSYWGVVLLQESEVLNDDEYNLSIFQFSLKQYDSSVIVAHEVTHQWIGGLISPMAPNAGSWIVEGLPTYFQSFIVTKIIGLSEMSDFGFIGTIYNSFRTDDELLINNTLMDLTTKTLLYGENRHLKGGSMMYMIQTLVTKDVFDSAIKIFLKDRKYEAFSINDFWSAIEEAIAESNLEKLKNINIRRLESFLSLPGYPIIHVRRDYESGNITLTQTSDFTNEKFWIPISIKLISSSEKREIGYVSVQKRVITEWMSPETEDVTIAVNPKEFYIININKGYYRVHYDEENMEKIIQHLFSLDFVEISILDRINILKDALFFYSESDRNDLFHKLLEYLMHETNITFLMCSLNIFMNIMSKNVTLDQDLVLGFAERIYRLIGESPQTIESLDRSIVRTTVFYVCDTLKLNCYKN